MHNPSFMRRDLSVGVMGPRRLEVDKSITSGSEDEGGVGRGAGVDIPGVDVPEETLGVGILGAEEDRVVPYANGLRSEAWTERKRLSIFCRTLMVSSREAGRSTVIRADFNSSLRPSRRIERLASST